MDTLDKSIRSSQIPCAGLLIHVLECGDAGNDIILLLHGFPELAFSWRKVLPLLAQAGYHVIAPDMRGYGKTVSMDSEGEVSYDQGLAGFSMIDTVAEMVALVNNIYAATHPQSRVPVVKCVVGHDMGSAVAANLALARPDIFKSLVMMSAPYTGPPTLRSDPAMTARLETVKALSELNPPRKHYQVYFCRPDANDDLMHAKQGLAQFYRGYYYYKSAHWHENKPHKLGDKWTVDGLSQLPEYYVMQADKSMSETVHDALVNDAETMESVMSWMTDAELQYYVTEFSRTGFQGGLNHYRVRVGGVDSHQLSVFAGRGITVPTIFVSGAADWGNYQDPGGIEKMQSDEVVEAGQFMGCTFVQGAGHWVQQEQPQQTATAILQFLQNV